MLTDCYTFTVTGIENYIIIILLIFCTHSAMSSYLSSGDPAKLLRNLSERVFFIVRGILGARKFLNDNGEKNGVGGSSYTALIARAFFFVLSVAFNLRDCISPCPI